MNNRVGPWRKKPPTELLPLMEQALDIRLYLIQELGPTLFVFKDDDGNKIKVQIGLHLGCSLCDPLTDHCIHTLYVMQRIYQINAENPLLWQCSYIDSEISDLCRLRYRPETRGNKKHNYLKRRSQTTNSKTKERNIGSAGGSIRKTYDENDVCPICHDSLAEEQGLTYCKKSCGSNFHINCLLIWAEHRHSHSEKISCPMCRTDWGTQAYPKIKQEKEEFEARFILHKGHKCASCKKVIKGRLFHCVYCENTEICEKCFLGFEHYIHDRFLVKENVADTWKIARSREKMYLKKNHAALGNIKSIGLSEELYGIDHRIAILNLESNPKPDEQDMNKELCVDRYIDWDAFIVNCLPNIGLDDGDRGTEGMGVGLQIVGRDLRKKCVICRKENADSRKMRRLFCGHPVDDECFVKILKSRGKFICPEDNLEMLKGWPTAFKKPKTEEPKAEPEMKRNDTLKELLEPNVKTLEPPSNKSSKSQGIKRELSSQLKENKKVGQRVLPPRTGLHKLPPKPQKKLEVEGFELEGMKFGSNFQSGGDSQPKTLGLQEALVGNAISYGRSTKQKKPPMAHRLPSIGDGPEIVARKIEPTEIPVVGMKKRVGAVGAINKKILINANKFNRQNSGGLSEGVEMALAGKAVRNRDSGGSKNQIPVSGGRYYQTQEYDDFENEAQIRGFEDRDDGPEGIDHGDIHELQSEDRGGNSVHNDGPVNLNDSEFEDNL